MDKNTQRQQIRERLKGLTKDTYEKNSFTIMNQLLKDSMIRNSHTIAVTIARFPEVQTSFLIEQLWQQNKRVVVPKCDVKTRAMSFFEITSFDQLEQVYMDLLEPIKEQTCLVEKSEIDVIIVPGIVFDLNGYRIGYGGGYYDKYLADFNGATVAVAFDFQIVPCVPRESHDIPVQKIITNMRTIACLSKE